MPVTRSAQFAGQLGASWARTEELNAWAPTLLAALFDKPSVDWEQCDLPPLAHWVYFLPRTNQSALGADGHPTADGFVPPPHLPRRMWAGGHVEWIAPLRVGMRVTRRSVVTAIEEKRGRAGAFLLVRLNHEYLTTAGLAVRERQDLIYRAPATPVVEAARPPTQTVAIKVPGPEQPAGCAGVSSRVVKPDPLLLFRFSALTFNAHRIHYDRDYCRLVEGYPGLVVQGPLVAMLMLDQALMHPGTAAVRCFEYRSHGPLFDGEELQIESTLAETSATVACRGTDGREAATAVVEFGTERCPRLTMDTLRVQTRP
jgi:3-methylfumaryl-CoA hydratase